MSDIFATAGALLYIGPTASIKNSDFVLADFEPVTPLVWTSVGFIEDFGEFGDTAKAVTANPVDHPREITLKGTRDAGNMALSIDIKDDDTGQIAMVAAQLTNFNYNFKIVFPNMPAGGTSGSKRYFIGLVMGTPEQLGGANTVGMMKASLKLNSNIVRVAAV